MKATRLLWVPFVAGTVLAACSGGSFGSSTLPQGGPSPLAQVVASPTPTPLAASSIVTFGAQRSGAAQPLPNIQGYGGTITFAVASPSPGVKTAPTEVPIGITAGIVEPTDAPKFDAKGEYEHKSFLLGKKYNEKAPRPLFFISLLATSDVTLTSYPALAINVPRDIVTKYRTGTFALALFDPADKEKHYRLAVAERDLATPGPGGFATPVPTPTPQATATPSPSPRPSPTGSVNPLAPPTVLVASPSPSPTLPPERIAFQGTASELKLAANRPVVFALYVIPAPSASPSPSPAPHTTGSPSPVPHAAGSPTASTVPATPPSSPSATGSPTATAPPSSTPAPTKT
jgi:hypothetical protein